MTSHTAAPGRLARVFQGLTVGAVATHHVIETAGGLGPPGEPVLGRRVAAAGLLTAFAANLGLISTARTSLRRTAPEATSPDLHEPAATPKYSRAREAVLGFVNGAYQALALQHYVDWPWTIRCGVPILTEAEGLPQRLLPSYNAALLATIAASTASVISARRSRAAVVGHLAGLATFRFQLASARQHIGWWRTEDASRAE